MWKVTAVGLISHAPYAYLVDLPVDADRSDVLRAAVVRHSLELRNNGSPELLNAAAGAYTVTWLASSCCLSPEQLKILRLVANGFSNREIGKAVYLDEGVVKGRVAGLRCALDARDRAQLVAKAFRMEILKPVDIRSQHDERKETA